MEGEGSNVRLNNHIDSAESFFLGPGHSNHYCSNDSHSRLAFRGKIDIRVVYVSCLNSFFEHGHNCL